MVHGSPGPDDAIAPAAIVTPDALVAVHRLVAGGRRASWRPGTPAYVALDVDGTLVTDGAIPAAPILSAIERLTGLGLHVGLATGRMAAANGPLLDTGVFTGPHVFHNGAVVQDGDGTERVTLGLDDDAVQAVLSFGRERDDVSVEIYVDGTYLTDRDDQRSWPHRALLGLAPSGVIRSVADLSGRTAVKAVVVCFTPDAAIATALAVSALGLAAGPAASPATPELRYVNVTRQGVDKGSGVRAAAELLGVGLDRVAAIGDETNDLPVLGMVGTGIAMGDAGTTVRDRAHLIAPCFADGGTVAALELIARMVEGRPVQREPGT
jgi:Cof subfamily protein (haloacid dehalogenase superfamily)